MEDFYIRIESYGIYAILDGHSGTYAAQRVRDVLIEKITNYIKSGENDFINQLRIYVDDVESILKTRYLLEKQANKRFEDDGTTLCLIVAEKTKLTVANVGDSRAVLYHANGIPFNQTRDHKADDPIEMKRILDDGGFIDDGRVNGHLAIARSLGDFWEKIEHGDPISAEPEMFEWDLFPETKFLIIASDGLWDSMNSDEAIQILRKYYLSDSDFGAERLVKHAQRDPFSFDNISVIVVVFRHGQYQVGYSSVAKIASK